MNNNWVTTEEREREREGGLGRKGEKATAGLGMGADL